MESSLDIDQQIPSLAAQYTDRMNTTIESNSSWWYDAEGDLDARFGASIGESITQSKKLSKINPSKNTLPSIHMSVNLFVDALNRARLDGRALEEFYRSKNSNKDNQVLGQFMEIVDDAFGEWTSISTLMTPLDETNDMRTPPRNTDEPLTETVTAQVLYFILRIYDGRWNDVPVNEVGNSTNNAGISWLKAFPENSRINCFVLETFGAAAFQSEEIIFEVDKGIRQMFGTTTAFNPTALSKATLDVPWLKPLLDQYPDAGPIPLSQDQYLNLKDYFINGFYPGDIENTASLSMLDTDVVSETSVDQLDFQKDYEALANLIAYREAVAPLAIGLFGNWGMGKSFFMRKLQFTIGELVKKNSGQYCTDIVHINFNSWHYSDANLWASLITKIFDDLKMYKHDNPEQLKNLYKNLHSSVEKANELKLVESQQDAELRELTSKKDVIDKELRDSSEQLNNLSTSEIVRSVWNDDIVQADINVIKDKIPGKTLRSVEDVKKHADELGVFIYRVRESWRILRRFKGDNKFLIIAFALIIFLISFFTARYLFAATGIINWLSTIVSGLVSLFGSFMVLLSPAMKVVNFAHARLVSLDKKLDELQAAARKKQDEQTAAIEKEIAEKKSIAQQTESRLSDLRIEQIKIKTSIEEIESGKKLVDFLKERAADSRYADSLGIISWVRHDFEELDFLLKQQYEVSAEDLRKLQKKKVENIFKVDRIILYIDDLDRCNTDIVIRVLEAVHLLLTFPLFVVIVGVDPRWVQTALSEKYKAFLKDNPNVRFQGEATTLDYLEKIFQIPFALRGMNQVSRKKLIKNTLMTKKVLAPLPPTAPPPVPGPQPHGKQPGTALGQAEADKGMPVLDISEDESRIMQELDFITGNSPRTIKRYINIYRVIRVHAGYQFTDNDLLSHYAATMVMLGIMISLPLETSSWFSEILSSDDNLPFEAFLNDRESSTDDKKMNVELLKKTVNVSVGKILVGCINMEKFKKNLPLISRFSFHRYA
jgi:hypothetical protein